MLNNQNIKQKPIPFFIYLSYVLSYLTPVTTAIAVAPSPSSSSLLLFVLYGTTQEVQSTIAFSFLFGFVSQQPFTLI
jgi:hypothetical protein